MNSAKPTLSVTMANYNYGHWLTESLEAILTQSHPPKEVIIVDDGSTDNSIEVIKSFMAKYQNIKFIKNDKNMGGLYSTKKALDLATGDYTYSAASDDRVLPGFFEKSLALLSKHPQAGLCCTNRYSLDNTTKEMRVRGNPLSKKPCYFSPSETLKLFMKAIFTPLKVHSVIVKRSLLIKEGGYLPRLKWSADSFVFSVISFRHGICHVPEPLVIMRNHGTQYGGSNATDTEKERNLIKEMIEVSRQPEYSDIYTMFTKSAPFSTRPEETLRVIISDKKYRDFFSIKLLRQLPLSQAISVVFTTKIGNITTFFKNIIKK